MTKVTVSVNGNNYEVACENGQEKHLLELTKMVEEHCSKLVGSLGDVSNAQLMLLVSLTLADELHDLKFGNSKKNTEDLLQVKTADIDSLAKRIETIAQKLSKYADYVFSGQGGSVVHILDSLNKIV